VSGIEHRFHDLPAVLRRPMARRAFLSLLGLAGLAACVRDETSSPPGGFLERTVDSPRPEFDPDTYRLVVNGLVERPLNLTYRDLLSLPSASQTCDFRCVEGWGVDDVPWEGVRLQSLIDMVQPSAEAGFVTFHSLGGQYQESLSLEQAGMPGVMLAYRMYGDALPPERGSPLRLVFPRMFGYKGAKWVTRVEFRAERDLGYWEGFGYPSDGWVADEQPCSQYAGLGRESGWVP
jgi:DMSO/TMAO reductase YedYZ molybdopterin-dependent catalytic subunit